MSVDFYQDAEDNWRWRLTGTNGEIVAQGEGHGTEQDARRSFTRMTEIAAQTLTDMEGGEGNS